MSSMPSTVPSAFHLRPDLRVIAGLIPAGSRVLDLGCGDGALLEYLVQEKQVRGRGIELDEGNVLTCVRKGLTVRQGDLEEGLADYPDLRFDYVVLSQTLPFLDNPAFILDEMLRVGRHAIVSFPNWGYWRCRLELLLTGRIPQAPDLPQRWYDVPRWQAFTITDFARFTRTVGIRITRQVYLANGRVSPIRKFKNLMATTAIFQLERPMPDADNREEPSSG
ncbi:MAG: methionine biosynthesis protein MetW [Chloroflexi bacterium]|nr:MAG: methionine biosynthesis protein MetW [Chloroflexota bacterium]